MKILLSNDDGVDAPGLRILAATLSEVAEVVVVAPDADLVMAGINSGHNLGDDVLISGTVAAAMQGYLRGYPAFAVSVAEAATFPQAALVARQLGVVHAPLRIDSQCKYAVVARGDASIYLRLPLEDEYQEKIWDHAAGALIVAEAGGRVTDVDGQRLDFSTGAKLLRNRGIIASNGRLHAAVLEAVRRVRA